MALHKMRFTAILLSAMCCLCFTACGQNVEAQWQEQYDLGVRYLSEGNYEEAIIAFTTAIEIDPKRPEAYVVLAELYAERGEVEIASEILEHGVAACGDLEIFARFRKEYLNDSQSLLEAGLTDQMITFEEVRCLGHSVIGLDIQTLYDLMMEKGFQQVDLSEETETDRAHWFAVGNTSAGYDSTQLTGLQYSDEDYVCLWSFSAGRDRYPIGVRGIRMLDSIGEVFSELGFSNGEEIEEAFREIIGREFDTTDQVLEELRDLFECDLPGIRVAVEGGSVGITEEGKATYGFMRIGFLNHNAETSQQYFVFTFGGPYSNYGSPEGDYSENPELLAQYEVHIW